MPEVPTGAESTRRLQGRKPGGNKKQALTAVQLAQRAQLGLAMRL